MKDGLIPKPEGMAATNWRYQQIKSIWLTSSVFWRAPSPWFLVRLIAFMNLVNRVKRLTYAVLKMHLFSFVTTWFTA